MSFFLPRGSNAKWAVYVAGAMALGLAFTSSLDQQQHIHGALRRVWAGVLLLAVLLHLPRTLGLSIHRMLENDRNLILQRDLVSATIRAVVMALVAALNGWLLYLGLQSETTDFWYAHASGWMTLITYVFAMYYLYVTVVLWRWPTLLQSHFDKKSN